MSMTTLIGTALLDSRAASIGFVQIEEEAVDNSLHLARRYNFLESIHEPFFAQIEGAIGVFYDFAQISTVQSIV